MAVSVRFEDLLAEFQDKIVLHSSKVVMLSVRLFGGQIHNSDSLCQG